MSLLILPHNQKHYDETIAFAERRGIKDKLDRELKRLTEWDHDVECELYPDAPASFGFVLRRIISGPTEKDNCPSRTDSQKEELGHQRGSLMQSECAWCGIKMAYRHTMFNGGLLYYGKGEDGVAGPQFSVRLGAVDGDLPEGWEIHT